MFSLSHIVFSVCSHSAILFSVCVLTLPYCFQCVFLLYHIDFSVCSHSAILFSVCVLTLPYCFQCVFLLCHIVFSECSYSATLVLVRPRILIVSFHYDCVMSFFEPVVPSFQTIPFDFRCDISGPTPVWLCLRDCVSLVQLGLT